MKANGGLITRADLAAYKAQQREPVRSTYRGFEIVGFPPPSSGGVHVAQILNILEAFDLASMPPDSPRFVHHVAEAMRLALPTAPTGWATLTSPRCRRVWSLKNTHPNWPGESTPTR